MPRMRGLDGRRAPRGARKTTGPARRKIALAAGGACRRAGGEDRRDRAGDDRPHRSEHAVGDVDGGFFAQCGRSRDAPPRRADVFAFSQREKVSPQATDEGLRRCGCHSQARRRRSSNLQRRIPSPGCFAATLSLWERVPSRSASPDGDGGATRERAGERRAAKRAAGKDRSRSISSSTTTASPPRSAASSTRISR